jgi:hypothetical protein
VILAVQQRDPSLEVLVMLFPRLRLWAIATCAAASAFSAQAGDAWRVVDSVGAVHVGGAGVVPVALTRDFELPANSWIETANTGRVILVRDHETVVIEPNSRVQLPGEKANGNTQVLQSLGSALYKIGKQKKPHFQVNTPYLAAVVKGTAFRVKVEDGEASVEVTEGLVEVSTPDQSDVEFIRPGFTALVSRDHGNITVDPTPGKTGPQEPDQTDKAKEPSTQNVVIQQPIGDVEVDVKTASEGLAFNDANVSDEPKGKVDTDSDGGGSLKEADATNSKDVSAPEVDGKGESVHVADAADQPAPAVGETPPALDAPDLGNDGGGNGGGNGGGSTGGSSGSGPNKDPVGVDVGELADKRSRSKSAD